MLIDLDALFDLHEQSIIRWKAEALRFTQQDFFALVEENHAFNFQLWNAEDRARRDDQGYQYVYEAKREIDGFNQQRNNRMEAMDEWLYNNLSPSTSASCPVHSETPGMIIDRLSILALKTYHMDLQTRREDASEAHRQLCQRKLDTLHLQQQQLQQCLREFIEEIRAGSRTFRVYHQFKMYNDPTLNPFLYQKK
ncbi:hypothetical protein Lqui_0683 [Legionella quinlivanii]|uniref:DUF4254 domain-containing protein n=1 Tax=Legionella quinlivanii TaxID=45073 RepID=A0A0W0Y593_9GAMM|nr:DUF4254 domain-containing protein [Legionella quinlivanii]KTD51839.1 hypothetical protein Lqui_0683 [Legionella quinlivanii]SEF82528.1 Protein of unknown function [Legionella quinlivanii DSM 21216]STY09700.1 Uncharacterised protein [Legionella quinlivanii]